MRKIFFSVVGLLIVGYVFTYWMQVRNVKESCEGLKTTEQVPDIELFEKNIWLTVMGPIEDEETGNMKLVLCSASTMCDTSCNITYKDNRIISAEFFNY